VAMKIEAIAGRGSRKDFVDLRVLCRAGLTLDTAFDLFDRKYGTQRTDRYHRLRSPRLSAENRYHFRRSSKATS
jgi:hypothetical protein